MDWADKVRPKVWRCVGFYLLSSGLPVLFQRTEQGLGAISVSTGNLKTFVKALQSRREKSVLIPNEVVFTLSKMVEEEGAGE